MNQHKYFKLVHNNVNHEQWFVVNWCLGNTCNYSCSYCPSDLHDGSRRWPDANVVKNFIAKCNDYHYPRKMYFEFTGGEVTLWPAFLEVSEFCNDLGVKIGLISNGSRTTRWWNENKHLFDHVCLSFHPEQANSEHFIAVINELHNDLRVHVNLMMKPEKFEECYNIANKIKSISNISMALQPLIHDFQSKLFDYSVVQHKILDRQHDLIIKHIKHDRDFDYYRGAMRQLTRESDNTITDVVASAQRMVADGKNNWQGWHCWAGVEQLIVDMDGTIYRGWCKEGGRIGHIDEEFTLTTEPIICSKTMCHCNYDIMSTKEYRE